MNAALPAPHEAKQLHRLRTLRVQRARERCTVAQAAVVGAADAVTERQRRIELGRRDIDALGHAVVNGFAPQLPRWAEMVIAQRDRLADRLERDEYALIADEQKLEEAKDALQQARAELTRALAREDAVRGLAHRSRQAYLAERERRGERELEDQGPTSALRRRQP